MLACGHSIAGKLGNSSGPYPFLPHLPAVSPNAGLHSFGKGMGYIVVPAKQGSLAEAHQTCNLYLDFKFGPRLVIRLNWVSPVKR